MAESCFQPSAYLWCWPARGFRIERVYQKLEIFQSVHWLYNKTIVDNGVIYCDVISNGEYQHWPRPSPFDWISHHIQWFKSKQVYRRCLSGHKTLFQRRVPARCDIRKTRLKPQAGLLGKLCYGREMNPYKILAWRWINKIFTFLLFFFIVYV